MFKISDLHMSKDTSICLFDVSCKSVLLLRASFIFLLYAKTSCFQVCSFLYRKDCAWEEMPQGTIHTCWVEVRCWAWTMNMDFCMFFKRSKCAPVMIVVMDSGFARNISAAWVSNFRFPAASQHKYTFINFCITFDSIQKIAMWRCFIRVHIWSLCCSHASVCSSHRA